MSKSRQPDTAKTFRELHRASQGFIMPNAWDAGTARIFEAEGFKAIATTSGGIAFSLAKQDYQVANTRYAVTQEEMFDRMRQIVEAVSIPVNGDLEAGYGDRPEDVAQTTVMAIEAGLAGGNIEDKKPFENSLYEEDLAVERIAAAHEAIASRANAFVLTARTDAYLYASDDALGTVIRRANRFFEAGATCVFAPGFADIETIKLMVKEVNGPVNTVVGLSSAKGNAHEMIDAGVQRISIGGSLARSVLSYVRQCAKDLRETGSFDFPSTQISQSDLNTLFARSTE
ncbi:MAG: 2-methylisocitrate lyase [Rhodobiaceae bacterium]|nr:MAG: 2-methylisocitrate lyase [Rhodobiaceae bacterium]